MITKLHGRPGLHWTARAGGLISSEQEIKAAPGSGLRLFVTSLFVVLGDNITWTLAIRSGTTKRKQFVINRQHYTEYLVFPGGLLLAANEALVLESVDGVLSSGYGYSASGLIVPAA